MSDKLMNTEPGGESTQYESIKTVTVPTHKSGGDLGEPETAVSNDGTGKTAEEQQQRGEQTANNIRYGQNISESGMGGMTAGNGGVANTDVGYGGTDDATQDADADKSAAETRKEQGYGGDEDMDRSIGA